jgi:hypothetical protein
MIEPVVQGIVEDLDALFRIQDPAKPAAAAEPDNGDRNAGSPEGPGGEAFGIISSRA